MKNVLKRIALVAAVACAASCTMKKQEAPELSGPSEFGTSVALTVTPDILTQDGASQSLVSIMARDSNGQALRNLSLRAEIEVGGLRADYGSLSARNLVTGNDGRASLVYTAPPAPAIGVDAGMVVTIAITPVGTDFGNSSPRSVSIRLVPPGVVVPPNDDFKAAFTVTPPAPSDSETVLFDASSSSAAAGNAIVSYSWNFGDGGRGSGVTTTHAYDTAGTYVVTLTVTDQVGRSAQKSQSVLVTAGMIPTVAFTSSPVNPLPDETVFFNANASKAAPGRSIVSYQWDFGDGSSESGVQPSHIYRRTGGYNVSLTITDDSGRTATLAHVVTVGSDSPTPDFSFEPSSPSVNVQVAFNASASKAVAGRTIKSYTWSFSDGGAPQSGVAVQKSFPTAGSFNVTLTITDSAGKSATLSKAITVK